MQVTKVHQLIPGIWSVGADTGTVAALGTIRQTASGFAFRGQGAATSKARNELALAGIRSHEWARDGFASIEDAVAYLNERLAA